MSDVTLTLGVDAGELKKELQGAINSAVASIEPLKLKVDTKALSKSLGSIKVDVDQSYLRQQVQSALQDLGKFVNGSGSGLINITGKLFNTSIKSHAAEYNKLLGQIEKVGKMQASINNSKYASNNLSGRLAGEAAALNQLAEAARSGKMSLEAFYSQRDQANKRVANFSAEVENVKALEKQAQAEAKAADEAAKAAEKKAQAEERAAAASERAAQKQAQADERAAQKASAQQLQDEARGADSLTRAYSELDKVRNAMKSIPKGLDIRDKLAENEHALQSLIQQYKDGDISAREFANGIKKISASNAEHISTAKELGVYASKFNDQLQRFKQHLTTVTSIVRAFQMLRMVIQPIVKAVTEVDSAMAQLKIVTQANNAEIEQYSKNIMDVADETAGSVKDLINSTTTFSRLGFDLDKSTELAKYTQMLENVGDIDESEATSAITAIVKAFNVGEEELESVMDRMVKVGKVLPRRMVTCA